MNVFEFINNKGLTEVPNPNYNPKAKKNKQPKTVQVPDIYPNNSSLALNLASKDAENYYSVNYKDVEKYLKRGYNYNPDVNLDAQIAKTQSTGEKFWNAAKQAIWSEVILGTVQGFADLYDVFTGEILRSDNDYQNPVSAYLEECRENYRNNNPIFVDPNKNVLNGGLIDAGWWASNLPSVMSSLTLLIPSTGIAKGLSWLGRALKIGKGVSYARKATMGMNRLNKIREAEKAGKAIAFTEQELASINGFGRWANKQSTITAANRMFENGLTAAGMRTLENYQEARQTYNDMYKQAYESLDAMSNEEYQAFLNKNAKEIESYEVDPNDRNAVAKAMASRAADKTFLIDYSNLIWDYFQISALRNPLKLAKNMRQTSATRKAERLARQHAGKTAEQIAELEAKKTFKSKIKDFFSDHIYAGHIFLAESSEGVEEAVNYIATQEGMNYGKLMLDSEDANHDDLSNRLNSYLASPELYDAAFWGVMGGVMFQKGGSQFNRAKNLISAKIKDRKNNNKKTSESNNTNWREKYETSENKRRVSEINSRNAALNTLAERLEMIEDENNPRNPFMRDINDPSKQAVLTTDIERQVARDRAIDEFIVSTTFRALDNGNYDALKAYLRDENVRKALEEKGIIENTGVNSVEKFIQRMDEIEQMYDDNMLAINGISQTFVDAPFEYIQIIARDNTEAQIQMQRIDNTINEYKTSAAANNKRFGANLDSSINYQAAVDLVISAKKLGMLRAQKRAIMSDKKRAQSIDGQTALANINKEIDLINKHIFEEDVVGENGTYSSLNDKLAKLLWATGVSSRTTISDDGSYQQNQVTDEYRDYLDALTKRDFKKISEITGREFEVSDEDIIKLLGENESSTGSYHSLSQDISLAFDQEKGLQNRAPELDEDYQNLAALRLAKLAQQAKIANTTETISDRINELHNSMNEARKKAIEESEKIIFDLTKKYDKVDLLEYIFNNEEIENMDESDKNRLDDAIEVLNLTATSNQSLGKNLQSLLLLSDAFHETNEDEESQKNDTKNQTNSNQTKPNTDNSSQQQPQSTQQAQSGQNEGVMNDSTAENTLIPQSDKLTITSNIDGGVDVAVNNDGAYGYSEATNGDMHLQKGNIRLNNLRNTDLWDGFDANLHKDAENVDDIVESYPIIAKDENGKYYVKQKGVINYNKPKQQSSSSTGEGVNVDTGVAPAAPAAPAATPSNEEKNTPDKDVLPPNATEELNEKVYEAEVEFRNIIKNRDKTLPIENAINDAKQTILEKYKNEPNIADIEQAVTRQAKYAYNRAKRQGLAKSSAEVLFSSITELPNGKYDITEQYKKFVEQMLVDYCRQVGIREVGGKYYINIEDMFRNINQLYEDKNATDMLYGAFKQYLKTDDAKNKFIATDNVESSNFLDNVKKSIDDRIIERIGIKNAHGVNIDRLVENPTPEYNKVFNSLRRGDSLSIEVVNGEIQLVKDGVTIGTLPTPLVDSKTGRFYKINKGWKSDVGRENNNVVSKLQQLLESIILDDGIGREINDAISELSFDKISKERKEELINFIYDKLVNTYDVINKGFVDSSASKETVVDGLRQLWAYVDIRTIEPNFRNIYIRRSLNTWFEKLYDSYKTIDDLQYILKNKPNTTIKITVDNISSGEIIRIVDQSTRNTGNNYDKYTQSNDAFAEPDSVELGIVDINKGTDLITTEGKVIQHEAGGTFLGGGTIYCVLPNLNGKNQYVVATSTHFNDKNLKGDAREIIDALKDELNRQIDRFIEKGDYNELFDFLRELFYNTNKTQTNRGVKRNTSLLRNIWFEKQINNEYGFKLNINPTRKNELVTSINVHNKSDGSRTFNYTRKGKSDRINGDLNNKNDIKIFKELINEIFDAGLFNVSAKYFSVDNVNVDSAGFLRNAGGKFRIAIPNSETGVPLIKKYSSYKDFVVKGGFIRVNTRQENGSNFRRRGENQAANAMLEVSIISTTSSPVTDQSTETTSNASNAETILKDDSISNKATELLKNTFDEETLNSLEKLHLLPKNIIFDENLNEQDSDKEWLGDNAVAVIADDSITGRKKGQTIIGRRWLDMFNEEGQFGNAQQGAYKAQAIRKLIHEQLHHKLNQRGRKEYLSKIEEIYNDFKKALDDGVLDSSKHDVEHLREYLKENESRDVQLEEFLVESLTSGELVAALNDIKVDFEKGKLNNNLWQKILKLLNDIFGWEIVKGSLREKELYHLQRQIKNIENGVEELNKTKAKTTNKTEEVSTESNLNETDNTKTEEVTEEITETTLEDKSIEDELSDAFDEGFDDIFGSDTDIMHSNILENVPNDDILHSNITERPVNHPSVSEFVETLPIDIQPKFVRSVAAGEIETSCR